MISYSIHNISWALIFIGGIIVFHRAYEKFFRDKLENMRDRVGKLIDYHQANQGKNGISRQDDIANMYNHFIFLSRQLEELSDPVQKEINNCATWGAIILSLHLLLLLISIFSQDESSLEMWFNFCLVVVSGVICLILSNLARSSYRRLSKKAEATKNSVDIEYIETRMELSSILRVPR